MKGKEINWLQLAMDRGYNSTKRMLIELYYANGLSLRRIARLLKVSFKAVQLKMVALDLPRRQKGKPNGLADNVTCRCGHHKSLVLEGKRNSDGSYKRRRQCKRCNTQMTTKELVTKYS